MTRFKTLLTAFQDVSVKKSAIKAIVAITLVGGSFGIADNVGAQGPEDEAIPTNALSVNTAIIFDHSLSGGADEEVHNRASGYWSTEQLSPTEFFGNAYRLSGNTYTPRLHRGEVHEKLFKHIGTEYDRHADFLEVSDGEGGEIYLIDKLVEAHKTSGYSVNEFDTCVEYHFSVVISKDNGYVTDRTESGKQQAETWCPQIEMLFDNGELTHQNALLWNYTQHETLMRRTMHQASDFVHENAWKSAFSLAAEEDEAAEFLGHTNVLEDYSNVDIYVNIVVELVDRDSVVQTLLASLVN